MAFAALGAAEVLSVDPDNVLAAHLLSDAADAMNGPQPESRVAVAERTPHLRQRDPSRIDDRGRFRAGASRSSCAQGLDLLAWLLDRETRQGHLSVTPVGGSGPDDHGPGFDQQPIEVAALADACARAQAVDGDRRWVDGIAAAAGWFLGRQ